MNILEIKDLYVQYNTDDGTVHALNGVTFSLEKGETLGLVGETGAGKTTTALSIMGLIPDPPGEIVKGSIAFEGADLLKKSEAEMKQIRGQKISMIFQDPMTALNPIATVGTQIAEVIKLHNKEMSTDTTHRRAMDMLEIVGIPAERFDEYPHQFSGGMKQRVVIAIALACNPALLIADEPTTALDVTIQAQILSLIDQLKVDFNTSVILITHDLGVVAEMCNKVAIVYAGNIVEYGALADIYNSPRHPYTQGLFASIPSLTKKVRRLNSIQGLPPNMMDLPAGCAFCPRCSMAAPQCSTQRPDFVEVSPGHYVGCLQHGEGK